MTVADIIQSGILIILLITLIVLAWQTILQNKQIKLHYKWNMRQKAMEFSHFTDASVQKNIKKLTIAFPNYTNENTMITKKEIQLALENNPDIEIIIRSLLAHWENLAIAIDHGLADEELAYEMVAGTLVRYVNVFGSFIQLSQGNNIRLYTYLTELAKKWDIKLKQHSINDRNNDFK